MAVGAETPNIAALPTIARLGAGWKATVQHPRSPAQIFVSNCCSRAMSIRLSAVIIRNWAPRLSRRSGLLITWSSSRSCESARGPDADRHVKLLIQFAWRGHSRAAYSHRGDRSSKMRSAARSSASCAATMSPGRSGEAADSKSDYRVRKLSEPSPGRQCPWG
jgi:hypothetical protein